MIEQREETAVQEDSLVSIITGLLYPFIIVFGIYVILNGHDTPGGGFQGGAILAVLFIGRYLVAHSDDFNIHRAHNVEKALLAILILVPAVFVFGPLSRSYPQLNQIYLVFMNLLIGFKVALGLTIVVFRYAFFEDR